MTETDQKKVEEIERKRKEARKENFPLVYRQRLLLFEKLQHGFLPFFVARRAPAVSIGRCAATVGVPPRAVSSSGVLADGPAAPGEITFAGFNRRSFELGRHRVVEAVEEAEDAAAAMSDRPRLPG